MAYKKKTWEFRRAIEVMEYHTARYGAPGQKREKKKKPTKEDMEKVNQYTKERKARHRLRTYFYKNDYFSCLTYRVDARPPDMQAAKEGLERSTENHPQGIQETGRAAFLDEEYRSRNKGSLAYPSGRSTGYRIRT